MTGYKRHDLLLMLYFWSLFLHSMRKVCFYFLLAVLVLFSVKANATHLRAGDITLTRLSCSSYQYTITLHVYTKWGTPVKFGGGTLNFGDGSKPVITDARPTPPEIAQ